MFNLIPGRVRNGDGIGKFSLECDDGDILAIDDSGNLENAFAEIRRIVGKTNQTFGYGVASKKVLKNYLQVKHFTSTSHLLLEIQFLRCK